MTYVPAACTWCLSKAGTSNRSWSWQVRVIIPRCTINMEENLHNQRRLQVCREKASCQIVEISYISDDPFFKLIVLLNTAASNG